MISAWAAWVAILANCCAAQQASPGVLPPPSSGAPQLGPASGPPPSELLPGPRASAPQSPNFGSPDAGAGTFAEEVATPPGPYDSLLELIGEGTPGSLAEAMEAGPPPPEWYQPAYWFGPAPWDAGVQLGINGSEGNNSVFSMRTGGHLKRASGQWKFDSTLNYNKTVTNGIETQNNGVHDLRIDRLLADTPWTLFVLENFIYDEFQTYDVQLSLNTGIGYQWIKTEPTNLITRMGLGTLREFGGVENDWQPTALGGFDFTRQLTKMQRLTAKVDYFPEWEDFGNYRVLADFGWEIQLDQPKNMSLKVSAIDRYNSSPDGSTPNALDYAVMLIWGL